MKKLLTGLVVLTAVTGCVNPFAGNSESVDLCSDGAARRVHCIKQKKKVVKEVKKPSIKIFGLSIKELRSLALQHGSNEKLQDRIKRRIYFLQQRIEAEKRLRIEIELNGLKAEFSRLKKLRKRYSLGSFERKAINKTLRSIKEQIKKFNKENPQVMPINRKPAFYKPAHPAKLKLAIKDLKREIKILTVQFNQATGVHKIKLSLEIKELNKELKEMESK